MARAKPVTAAGPREQKLLDLVDERFGNVMDFARAVAKLTGKTAATEKSSYYRIVRGTPGDRVMWRLRHYAKALGVKPADLLEDWEAPVEEAAAQAELPLNLSPREVRDALQALIDRVGRLSGQVERLEQRQRPKNRRAVKR